MLEPLGMTSMQPDYPRMTIPHRTLGYQRVMGEWTIEGRGDDVS